MAATVANANAQLDALQKRMPRMYLQDLKTLEILEAQFNPAKLEEVLGVDWVKLTVPGLSHQRHQYNFTRNHAVSFELIFDALAAGNVIDMREARKFLLSVCYSKKGAQNVRDGEATRVLFVWPKLFSLTCVVTNLKISHTSFNLEGDPTYSTAALSLEEIRDARLYSEDVRNDGTQRVASADQQADFITKATK